MIPVVVSFLVVGIQSQQAKPDFEFLGKAFFHRFTQEGLSEYTPKGQEDLKKWIDMVTVNVYKDAKDGEALAKVANAVLDTYQDQGARVLRTDSVPQKGDKPAEHLIVVLFPRSEFAEAAFARFVLQDGQGWSVVYSRRTYGKNKSTAMSEWLKQNGKRTEEALMALKSVPKRS
jgi:hypothetical protein